MNTTVVTDKDNKEEILEQLQNISKNAIESLFKDNEKDEKPINSAINQATEIKDENKIKNKNKKINPYQLYENKAFLSKFKREILKTYPSTITFSKAVLSNLDELTFRFPECEELAKTFRQSWENIKNIMVQLKIHKTKREYPKYNKYDTSDALLKATEPVIEIINHKSIESEEPKLLEPKVLEPKLLEPKVLEQKSSEKTIEIKNICDLDSLDININDISPNDLVDLNSDISSSEEKEQYQGYHGECTGGRFGSYKFKKEHSSRGFGRRGFSGRGFIGRRFGRRGFSGRGFSGRGFSGRGFSGRGFNKRGIEKESL